MMRAAVRWKAVAAIGVALCLATSAAAADAPIQDWTVKLRSAVQLDPARGERLAAKIEAQARQQPPSDARQLIILTAQYFRAEALLQLNRAGDASPIVDEALTHVPGSPAGRKLKGQLLMVRAGILSDQGKAAESMRDFQAAYDLFSAVHSQRNAAVALMGIGSIYQDAGESDRVLYYYKLADEAYPGDPLLGLSSANNQANAYAVQKHYREAEASYRRALGFARAQHSPLLEARILSNIAAMQIDLGQLGDAAATLDNGLAISKRDPGAAEWRPLLLATKAQLALSMDRPDEAVRLIEEAVAGKSAATLADQSYRDLHRIAYDAYERVGRSDQALAHFKAFRKLDDDGRALVSETSAALLAARFDFANQNTRIATLKTGQLQRDIALARLKAKQNALILSGLLAMVTVIAAVLGLYLRSLRRSRNAVRAANTALIDVNTQLTHALSAKSRFLATTSHEIRTPLNGVLGMAQVLLAEPALTTDVRQRLTLLQGAGESMRRLVDDILEFAKIDAGSVEVQKDRVDLFELLDESVRFWQPQAVTSGLTIDKQLGAVPQYIFEDGRRLRQIVYNLLANALKFTPTGAVSLAADVTTGATGEMLAIAITDTGIGIAEDAFDTIFEMFNQVDTSTTRRFGGTGLGLAISRNLARALGGDLRVASTVGVGSTFTLELPLVRGIVPVDALAVPTGSFAEQLAQARVLMVGGSPIAQQVVGSLVAKQVAEFSSCPSVDAVPADRFADVDILIVDGTTVPAPDFTAMTGPLPSEDLPRHIVVLGANDADASQAHDYAGATLILPRPFTAGDLTETLERLFPPSAGVAANEDSTAADRVGHFAQQGGR